MALDKKPEAKAGTVKFDTVKGTILLTALQKKNVSANTADAPEAEKKEDR